jgi:hypothetical protein
MLGSTTFAPCQCNSAKLGNHVYSTQPELHKQSYGKLLQVCQAACQAVLRTSGPKSIQLETDLVVCSAQAQMETTRGTRAVPNFPPNQPITLYAVG